MARARPQHRKDVVRRRVRVLAWTTLLPIYFVMVFYRSVRPVGKLRIPSARVAMVVTKAPSEPFAVVAETLECMLSQDYPHDTWLADEDPSPETVAWCERRGVQSPPARDAKTTIA